VGPHPGQARQAVLKLSEFDLQAPLVRLCPAGEDVEDERRAVDDHDVEFALEVALLGRAQLAVDHDDVVVERLPQLLDLRQLAFADVGPGVRVVDLLRDRTNHFDVDRLSEARQLFQRVGRHPVLILLFHGDEECLLGRALGNDGFACDMGCLSFEEVMRS
jgi:hypothetical protein